MGKQQLFIICSLKKIMAGYKLNKEVLVFDRELTELDYFVKSFLEVLKKYSDYLIVSGFVSIATGRTRATEDVDILVPIPKKEIFERLFNDLIKNRFWCYQGKTAQETWDYAKNMQNIRFAKENQMFPNMEVVFINQSKKAKYYEFSHPQQIKVKDFEFKIPPLEFEIIYKEIVLKGKKDKEDASHLRAVFQDILKEDKFKECREIIKTELKSYKQ
jgi:hypothetical protein